MGKDLFIFYLGEYQSIQKNLIPLANKKSFVKTYFHEFDLYYHIFDDIALIGYFGKEFIKGNDTLPQLDLSLSMAPARPFTKISTSKHEQILEFSDFEHVEPDITDFVNSL